MNEYVKLLGKTKDHLMTGVSYMIPVIMAGAVPTAIALLVGGASCEGPIAQTLGSIGGLGMSLFIPVMAAYIAYAIADRPGIAPGLIGGMMASEIGSGFLGGIFAGLLAGYITYALKKIRVSPSFQALMPILVIPIVSTLAVTLLMKFVIGVPVKSAMDALTAWLSGMQGTNALVFGAILGAMVGFDFGGPVNKVAYGFGVGMMASELYAPMGAVGAAIAVAPVGMALATLLAPKLYDTEEKEAAKAAVALGCVTITEGAIPFAARDPFRVMIASSVGGAVAGGIAGVSGVTNMAPMGGIFILPVVGNPVMYLVATAAGCVVTALLVNILKSRSKAGNN